MEEVIRLVVSFLLRGEAKGSPKAILEKYSEIKKTV